MSTSTKKLRITSQGGRNFILVPEQHALTLRKFLQTQGVTSSQPQSVTRDTSSMELGKRDDVERVQALLNRWGK